MPRSNRGTTLRYDDGKLEIVTVGHLRFWFAMVVNVGRTVIAGFLCYYGILFVGYTIDVEDLMLNAVALEFIISIDEALFEALMPRAIKQFYERVKPFKLPEFYSYRGVDARGAIAVLGVFGCFGIALGSLVVPQVSRFAHHAAAPGSDADGDLVLPPGAYVRERPRCPLRGRRGLRCELGRRGGDKILVPSRHLN